MLKINGHDYQDPWRHARIIHRHPGWGATGGAGFRSKMASRIYPRAADPLEARSADVLDVRPARRDDAEGDADDELKRGISDSGTGRPKRFAAVELNTLPPDQHRAGLPGHRLAHGDRGAGTADCVFQRLLAAAGAWLNRRRKSPFRVALGAARGRLVRQLLTENVLLALLGGGMALLLAIGSLSLVPAILPPAGRCIVPSTSASTRKC